MQMRTYRRLPLLLMLTLVLIVPAGLFAQSEPIAGSAALSLVPTATQVAQGGTVSTAVKVDVTNVTGESPGGLRTPAVLGGYQIDVTFDNARLQLVDVWGGINHQFSAKPYFTALATANADGKVTLNAWHTAADAPTGLVDVANLMFTAIDAGSAGLTVTAQSLSTAVQGGQNPGAIPSTPGSTSIDVTGPRTVSGVAAVTLTPNLGSVRLNGALSAALTVDLAGVTTTANGATSPAVLGGYSIDVTFDKTRLRLDDITGGTGTGFMGTPTFTALSNANAAGVVTITAAQTNPDAPTGLVSVANLLFTAIQPGAAALGAAPASLASSNKGGAAPASIDGTTSAASVNIGPQTVIDGLATVTLPASPARVALNSTVTLPLRVDLTGVTNSSTNPASPASLGGYQIEVLFDNSRLTLTSVNGGTGAGFGVVPSHTNGPQANNNGRIVLAAAQTGNNPTGMVHVASLTFDTKGLGIANFTITPQSLSTPPQPSDNQNVAIGGSGIGSALEILASPVLSNLSPATVCQGGAAFTLTVNGTDFRQGAVVLFNGAARDTTLVSSTRVTALIRASDILSAGLATVRVMNPDNIGSGTLTLDVSPDTVAPVVTAPAAVDVMQTACVAGPDPQFTTGGATGATSATLASFINGGSAVDACSAVTTALAPQMSGSDVNNATFWNAGVHTVTFRFRDAAGNIGTATRQCTIRLWADLNQTNVVDAVDMTIMANYLVDNIAPGQGEFTAPLNVGDVNRDGVVDAVDFVAVANHLVGNIPCLVY